MPDLNNWNPDQHQESVSMEAMPPAEYAAIIVNSERCASQGNPNSQYLKLAWEILGQNHPQFANRKVFQNLNLWNDGAKKEETQRIANGELKSIVLAIGHAGPLPNSEALHHKPASIRLGSRQYDGKTYNEVKAVSPYAKFHGGQAAPQQATMQQQPAQPVTQQAPPQQAYAAPQAMQGQTYMPQPGMGQVAPPQQPQANPYQHQQQRQPGPNMAGMQAQQPQQTQQQPTTAEAMQQQLEGQQAPQGDQPAWMNKPQG